MEESHGRSTHHQWMIAILLLAFLLRIPYLDRQGLWWDETFSYSVSVADLPTLLESTIHDRVHPPLYYTLMHFWLALGHDELLLRFFSVLFGVISVSIMYVAASIVGGKSLGTLAALLLAVSPFNIWFSQEVRMYSLTTMLVLAATAALLRLLRDDTLLNWSAYGLLSLLALYSNYMHLFVIVSQAVFLVLFRRRYGTILRKWFCCMLVVGALFLPWVITIFASGGFYTASISWIPPARPSDVFWTLYSLTVGVTTNPRNMLNVVAVLIAISLAAFGLLTSRRKAGEEQRMMAFVLTWFALPLLLTLLISFDWPLPQKRSIYLDRFFNPLLPAFLIMVAYGLYKAFSARRAITAVAALIVCVSIAGSLHGLYYNDIYLRDQWREAIADLKANAQPNDVLLLRPHHYAPFYYYGLNGIDSLTVPYLASAEEYEGFLDSEVPPRLIDGGRLWTMVVCENANAHRFVEGNPQRLMEKVQSDELNTWLHSHYQLLEERIYTGVYLGSYGSEPGESPAGVTRISPVLRTIGFRYSVVKDVRYAA